MKRMGIIGLLGLAGIAFFSGCALKRPGLLHAEATPVHSRSNTATAKAADTEADRMKPLSENRPVNIVSDHLTYTDQGRVTIFTGHVKVRQEATQLQAPYLEVRSTDGQAFAKQGIRMIDLERGVTVTAQELEYKDTLEHALVHGQVQVDSHDQQGIPLRLTSEQLEWNAQSKEIKARERVKILYQGTTATAEAMDYDQVRQLVELSRPKDSKASLPRIEQDGNIIMGEKIFLHLKNHTYEARGSAYADASTAKSSAPPRSPKKEKP